MNPNWYVFAETSGLLPGFGCVGLEEDVVVAEHGIECLTQLQVTLIIRK